MLGITTCRLACDTHVISMGVMVRTAHCQFSKTIIYLEAKGGGTRAKYRPPTTLAPLFEAQRYMVDT